MDRFIDLIAISLYIQICYLKSNMDRFIAEAVKCVAYKL